MTPYQLLATPPQLPATPSSTQANKDKDYAQKAADRKADRSQAQKTSDTADASSIEDKKKKEAGSSSDKDAAFNAMMASFMISVAPTPQPVSTAVASATPVIVVQPATNDATGSALPGLPPVKNSDGQSTAAASSAGTFPDQLLAALTPGTPLLPAVPFDSQIQTPAAMASPAVPSIQSSTAITQALTVSSAATADPRLTACNITPAEMQKTAQILSGTSPAASSGPAQTMSAQASSDSPVIAVTISPSPQPLVTVNPMVIAAATQPAAATPQKITPTPVTASTDAVGSELTVDQASEFDPVEFRIAQKSPRPLSQPANAPIASGGTGVAQDTSIKAPVSNVAVHTAAIKGQLDHSSFDTALSSVFGSMTDASSLDMDGQTLTTNASTLPLGLSNPLTTPLIQNVSATESHPAVQTVAAIIAKGAKTEGAQTISIRLDPPDLGKLQVQMKYKKGEPLRVHVVLEKADTASMFQRDSHALESALNDAGLQTDGSSLSFEHSGDGSAFKDNLNQNPSGTEKNAGLTEASLAQDSSTVENATGTFIDSKTGVTRYNLRV